MYDPAVLELLTAHAGPRLDDLLSRLNPKGEVARILTAQISAYVDPETLAHKRLLDFGCGVGASSLALARFLPRTEIIGVELNAEQVKIGTLLQEQQGFTNLRFVASRPAIDCRLASGHSTSSCSAPCTSTCCQKNDRLCCPFYGLL